MADVPYSFEEIRRMRRMEYTWKEIGDHYDRAPSSVRGWFKREAEQRFDDASGTEDEPATLSESETRLLTKEEIARITTLEDLVEFFEVDTEAWMVRNFQINKWEQHSVEKGVVPLYQVRANLIRNVRRDAEIARQAFEQALQDMKDHAPVYKPVDEGLLRRLYEDHLFVLGLMDPHIGMLAWGRETGEDYDLEIALQDYRGAAAHLLSTAKQYRPEKILMVVGNDTLHVDALQDGKVGTTTAGTPQDFDSRLPKLFTEARRVIVHAIDKARLLAPVDVMIVTGNHDEASMYKLGEVLNAWYRNDKQVRVLNDPTLRKYYTYGRNLLGLTHGQEFKRKREPLALIMMDEAARAGIDLRKHPNREWLTGHFHGTAELEHMAPRQNLSETRGIRIRSLPGLTAVDAWHTKNGFWHQRASTGLAYKYSGGLAGLHEYHP